ncbi:MAG TPA: hypothetical protein VGR57_07325 [Ktedonobacterales bacterium]|nr:hypothetical protein [Ktedonobacterales bacterium]
MQRDPLPLLLAFRQNVYDALGPRRDTLFELLDALTSAGAVPSLAQVSLAAAHRRGHGSRYRALAHTGLDEQTLRQEVLGTMVDTPFPDAGTPPVQVYALDVRVWPRPDAVTSAERGSCHAARQTRGHHAGQPVVGGWRSHWLAQLGGAADRWTAPVEVARVPPHATANQVAVEQIVRLRRAACDAPTPRAAGGAAGAVPRQLVVCDAGDDAVQLTLGLAQALGCAAQEVAAQEVGLLVRVRADRCCSADPDPATGKATGRPRRHGHPQRCADPTTWQPPTATYATTDPQYGAVPVQAWSGLHGMPRDHAGRGRRDRHGTVPVVRGTLLRVCVERLPGHHAAHPPTPLWRWWSGDAGAGDGARDGNGAVPTLALLWRASLRRFALEQTLRFLKQARNGTRPHRRTPAQADRWSWLVLLADTHLRVARGRVVEHRLPWERPLPPDRLTPGRVQRAFSTVLPPVGTPAHAPKRRGRSPGRPPGRRSPPAVRYPVVKKTA